jgi:hypothetical protein
MTMYFEGRSTAEMQQTIDDHYSHKYHTRTPTTKPPAKEK